MLNIKYIKKKLKRQNQKKCPICKEFSSEKYSPFCSLLCCDKDLSKWIEGRYFIPERQEFENE